MGKNIKYIMISSFVNVAIFLFLGGGVGRKEEVGGGGVQKKFRKCSIIQMVVFF